MKALIPIAFISLVVFISGCTTGNILADQQANQGGIDREALEGFTSNLGGTQEEIELALKRIHNSFDSYDSRYNALDVFTATTITESIVTGMESKQESINDDFLAVEGMFSDIESVKSKVDISTLETKHQMILEDLDEIQTEFQAESALIKSCITSMGEYQKYSELNRDVIILYEEYQLKPMIVAMHLGDEEYDDAIQESSNILLVSGSIQGPISTTLPTIFAFIYTNLSGGLSWTFLPYL